MNPLTQRSYRKAACILICALAVTFIPPSGNAWARHDSGHFSRGGHPHVGHFYSSLPAALFATAVIAGMTYYIIDDVYYRHVPKGYVVVERPAPVITANAAPNGSVVVTAGLLNVRLGPNINQPVVRQVRNGTILSVWGSAPGWYYVQMADRTYGWVMANFTAPVAPPASG